MVQIIPSLSGKKILLGVTGGIACYKSCELVRRLQEQNVQVRVVLTQAAQAFITPLTFQALSGNPVHTDLFNLEQESKIGHIELADWPDLILIAPTTANFIAKAAQGLCDDLLSTLILASRAPLLFCPSMNVNMWENIATQKNITLLKERNHLILEPESGYLACGWQGAGRLPDTEIILNKVKEFFLSKESSLKEKQILITAGPTWESIDPVRIITSPASGKTGFALAEKAQKRGAHVILVSGPTSLTPPSGVDFIPIHSAQEMLEAVEKKWPTSDIMIATAAVADFKPKTKLPQKAKKENLIPTIELTRNPDILATMGKKKNPEQILVGFAAETQALAQEAKRKLLEKNLDMICANDVTRAGLGFGSINNQINFYFPDRDNIVLPILSKEKIAEEILNQIESIVARKAFLRTKNNKNKKSTIS